MERTIICPSGLTGKIKPLTARAASVLTDAKAIRSGRAADAILKACWEETIDLGPYPFASGVEWQNVLVCDRTAALIGIRQATYGDIYDIHLTCPSCTHKFFWDVPLSELTTKPLAPEAKTKLLTGSNDFEMQLSDGRKLVWRLLTGKDLSDWLPKLRDGREDLVVQVVKCRVKSIEGIPQPSIEDYISDLPMGEVQGLIEAMDAIDGGVETEIEIRCPGCHYEWPIELPLDLQGMFSPRKKTMMNMSLKHTGPQRG